MSLEATLRGAYPGLLRTDSWQLKDQDTLPALKVARILEQNNSYSSIELYPAKLTGHRNVPHNQIGSTVVAQPALNRRDDPFAVTSQRSKG